MFPETDFFKRRSTMFLLVNGRYYNTENAEPVKEDYLTLCGMRFPLKKARTLEEEEGSYLKRNRRIFDDYKEEIEKGINLEDKCLKDIAKDIEDKENIFFFLTHICSPHNRAIKRVDSKKALENKSASNKDNLIFPEIIDKDYAVINSRLYPLKQTDIPIFISLEGKNYTINPSPISVDEAESKFQRMLQERLKIKAIKNSKKVKEFEGKSVELDGKIVSLEIAVKVSKYAYCYEAEDIGYDTSIKSVYWIIAPHYNKTTSKKYNEGESAGTLLLTNGILGTSARFAERKNRNSPFVLANENHCIHCHLTGNSLEHKMLYLHSFAETVARNGAFHE